MPVGQFEVPKPNKLIAAMQQLYNTRPIAINELYHLAPQVYLGTYVSAEVGDPNLAVVRLQGGTQVRFVPKLAGLTLVAGDTIKLEKSGSIPLHIVGKVVGNINLALQGPSVGTPPGPATNYHLGTVTSSTAPVLWSAGTDHFGAGLTYQIFVNGSFKQTTGLGATSTTITGLKAGTTYKSYVQAVDGGGAASQPSNTVSFTTSGTAPDVPGINTKMYKATALRSYGYNGNNELDQWHNNQCYQGTSNGGHNQAGLIYFQSFENDRGAGKYDGKTMVTAKISVTFAHWYRGSGTAVVGTHDFDVIPNRLNDNTHFNQGRWNVHSTAGKAFTIDMGFNVAQEFQSSLATGIMIGYPSSHSTQYYGYTWGAGPHVPVLTLQWTT